MRIDIEAYQARWVTDFLAEEAIIKAQAQALTWYNHRHLGEIELAKRLLRASE